MIRKAVEEQSQDRPLSAVKTGGKARLVRVDAGRGLNNRLASLGFVPDVEISVISNGHPGPFVVVIKDVKMALGRGVAHKILVKSAGKERSFFLREKLGVPNNGPMKRIVVALAGNPNSGKSSLFNLLTGAHQHVANYPGVTVEKKQGVCRYQDHEIVVVDLPGTYSLTAYSMEELVARRFILEDKPDVVVDVVDASNIERNLYLGTQLIEMDPPLVFAFNMADLAKRRGLVFDLEQLSRLLEARIVPTVGNKGEGRTALLEAILRTAQEGRKARIHTVRYGSEIEEQITRIEGAVGEWEKGLVEKYGRRWLAVKLLEQDDEIVAQVGHREVLDAVDKSVRHLRGLFRDEPEIVMADRRYGFISGACQETIKNSVERRHDASDTIDAVVTNRILGLPIFLSLMYAVFWATFALGEYPMKGLEWLVRMGHVPACRGSGRRAARAGCGRCWSMG